LEEVQPQMNGMDADKMDDEAEFGEVSWLKTRRPRLIPLFNLRF
jgi:hypothetical protein